MIVPSGNPVSKGAQRFEIFTGKGKRRDWPPELKASIVAECYAGSEGEGDRAGEIGLTAVGESGSKFVGSAQLPICGGARRPEDSITVAITADDKQRSVYSAARASRPGIARLFTEAHRSVQLAEVNETVDRRPFAAADVKLFSKRITEHCGVEPAFDDARKSVAIGDAAPIHRALVEQAIVGGEHPGPWERPVAELELLVKGLVEREDAVVALCKCPLGAAVENEPRDFADYAIDCPGESLRSLAIGAVEDETGAVECLHQTLEITRELLIVDFKAEPLLEGPSFLCRDERRRIVLADLAQERLGHRGHGRDANFRAILAVGRACRTEKESEIAGVERIAELRPDRLDRVRRRQFRTILRLQDVLSALDYLRGASASIPLESGHRQIRALLPGNPVTQSLTPAGQRLIRLCCPFVTHRNQISRPGTRPADQR